MLEQHARGALDLASRFGAAGEADLGDVRVFAQRTAHLGAVAGDHVDHAIGETRFLSQRGQVQGELRRFFRRLDDHGAAGGEQRRDFQTVIISGEFQGTIAPTTPTGSRTVYESVLVPK